jgi:hypothetical protein
MQEFLAKLTTIGNVDTSLDPSVIPMQVHGVVDAEASLLSNQHVLVNTFANTSSAKDEAYMIKHGSKFINKYP